MAEGEASGSKDPLMEVGEKSEADEPEMAAEAESAFGGTEGDSSKVEDTATTVEDSPSEEDVPEPAAEVEDEPIHPAEKTDGPEEAAARPSEAAVPEKLADDVIRPPLWKRVLYGVFPALERSEFLESNFIISLTDSAI